MSSSQKDTQKSPLPKNFPLYFLIWLLLISALVFWMSTNADVVTSKVRIPYTTFLAQVRADNVTTVEITEDRISGAFAEPVLWPETETQTGLSSPTASSASQSSQTDPASPKTYSEFETVFPKDIGDPNLLPLLESKGVVIEISRANASWIFRMLLQGLPFIFLIILFIWMSRTFSQRQSGMSSFGQTRARRYSSNQSSVTFADVAGADEAKLDLREVVDFLSHPTKYHDIGAHIPRGVLLVGPPGTGKTLLARAVAGEANAPFFNLSGSEFVEMFVGVGASRVRDLFQQAKAAAPAIVFIDELDAVGRRRGAGMGTVNDEREQTLNQLLVEMDGFEPQHEIIILAATNRPDVLDPALLRPGRFDRHVTVELPDQKGREAILHVHTQHLNLASDVNLKVLAQITIGFSGADLANLANEAALIAARHNHILVMMADFEEAQERVLLGGTRALLMSDSQRRIIAFHESGHALAAWLIPVADPVHKVTIIPRGRALGVTEQLPNEECYNYSRTYLMARLAVMLAGRAAEELVIGDITTGAENDLVEATRLARRMVTRWGMSELGLVAFQTDDNQPFLGYSLTQGQEYSEATAAKIDQEVKQLLAERHNFVRRLLINGGAQLSRLALALLKEETIGQERLIEILGPRPKNPPVKMDGYVFPLDGQIGKIEAGQDQVDSVKDQIPV